MFSGHFLSFFLTSCSHLAIYLVCFPTLISLGLTRTTSNLPFANPPFPMSWVQLIPLPWRWTQQVLPNFAAYLQCPNCTDNYLSSLLHYTCGQSAEWATLMWQTRWQEADICLIQQLHHILTGLTCNYDDILITFVLCYVLNMSPCTLFLPSYTSLPIPWNT